MVAPPGSVKSMLAQRFAGLLPPMSIENALESAAIASLAGRFDLTRWAQRPTGQPHRSASTVALLVGGREFQLNIRRSNKLRDRC
jgi:magnesium chelatase family protein